MEIEKNWVSIGVIALLLVVTVMQSFQLSDLAKKSAVFESGMSSLKTSVSSAKAAPVAAAAPTTAPAPKPSVPSSIANLPNMVGGC